MPDKSRRAAQARYQRRKAARKRLIERVAAGPQPARSEGTAKVTVTAASEVQVSSTLRYSVGNELRKIGILGGGLIVILIVISIILRYTME